MTTIPLPLQLTYAELDMNRGITAAPPSKGSMYVEVKHDWLTDWLPPQQYVCELYSYIALVVTPLAMYMYVLVYGY